MYSPPPVKNSDLMQLIGYSVESVDANPNGTLALHFVGGSVLRCFDDLEHYESYQIRNGNFEIYV